MDEPKPKTTTTTKPKPTTTVNVLIDNRKYTLDGDEPEEHFHRLADYVNKKIAEAKRCLPASRANFDTGALYLALNIANDFFKETKQKRRNEPKFDANAQEKAERANPTNMAARFSTRRRVKGLSAALSRNPGAGGPVSEAYERANMAARPVSEAYEREEALSLELEETSRARDELAAANAELTAANADLAERIAELEREKAALAEKISGLEAERAALIAERDSAVSELLDYIETFGEAEPNNGN
ncbi:MAG: cell division protein ZapA [Clostridiales bacterium]|jgi:cell division protein ZapA (FtsZ GTPase activity inhibitor)|nr:cell division protein ZapA [Clostridiales bacterium]